MIVQKVQNDEVQAGTQLPRCTANTYRMHRATRGQHDACLPRVNAGRAPAQRKCSLDRGVYTPKKTHLSTLQSSSRGQVPPLGPVRNGCRYTAYEISGTQRVLRVPRAAVPSINLQRRIVARQISPLVDLTL